MLGIFTPDIDRLKRNEDIEALIKCLSHKKPEIRSKAFSALKPWDTRKDVITAMRKLIDDQDSKVRTLALLKFTEISNSFNEANMKNIILNGRQAEKIELLRILSEKKGPLNEDISRIIVLALNDKKMIVRFEAIRTFGALKVTHTVPYLIENLDDESYRIRSEAAKALGNIGAPESVDALIGGLMDNNGEVRNSAHEALKKIPSEQALKAVNDAPVMIMAKKMSGSSTLRQETLQHIGKNRITDGIPLVLKALKDDFKTVRIEAITTIGLLRNSTCIEPLSVMLDDRYWDVRLEAVKAFERVADPRSLVYLEKAMKDANSNVKNQAQKSYNTLHYRLERLGRL